MTLESSTSEPAVLADLVRALAYLLPGALAVWLGHRLVERRLPAPAPPGEHPRASLLLSTVLVFMASGLLIGELTRPDPEAAPEEHVREDAPDPAAAEDPDERATAPTPLRLVAYTAAAMLLSSLYALAGLRRDGGRLADVGLGARAPRAALLLTLGVAAAAIPLQIGALSLERAAFGVFGLEVPLQDPVRQLQDNPELARDPLLVLMLVLLVPFGEELLYRGLVLSVLLRSFPTLRRRQSIPLAITLTAALFAAVHGAGHIPVFVQGLLLGYLYYRTRSLWMPVLFHGLHNGTALFIVSQLEGTGG